jgi:hypothetical protein
MTEAEATTQLLAFIVVTDYVSTPKDTDRFKSKFSGEVVRCGGVVAAFEAYKARILNYSQKMRPLGG